MPARTSKPKASGKTATKTAGAVKGGKDGKYQFNLARVRKVDAGSGYSTAHGGVIEGERMLVGYIHKPRARGRACAPIRTNSSIWW